MHVLAGSPRVTGTATELGSGGRLSIWNSQGGARELEQQALPSSGASLMAGQRGEHLGCREGEEQGAGCGGLDQQRSSAVFVLGRRHRTWTSSARAYFVPFSVILSGLLHAGLFQVPQVPARRPTRVLRPGGGARLQLSERAEHGVRGHGLQQRLPGAADLRGGSARQLVSTAAGGLGHGPRGPEVRAKNSFA